MEKNSGANGLDFVLSAGDIVERSIKSDKAAISVQLNPRFLSGPLSLTNSSDQTIYVKIISSGQKSNDKVADQKAINQNIDIDVSYESLDGTPINITELSRGTDMIAHVTIRNQRSRGALLKNMALTQIFPSGWEIQTVSNLGNVLEEDSYDYRDIRDDRVITFFDLKDKKEFRILLSASYEGNYLLPPVLCEAMYDQDIRALTKAKMVQVVQP